MTNNIFKKLRTLNVFIVLYFICSTAALAQDTVKIMSWNLLNYTVNEADRNGYYKTVIGSVSPDIFVCQEIAEGQPAVDSFYKNVIQQILPLHAKGLFVNGTDSDNAIFYDPLLFSFVSNTPIQTALRDINEFKLVKISSGDTLRIYSVHLKASSGSDNELKRAMEVDSLRKVTNLLINGSNFFVCGDFNLYNSNEAAYQKLMLNNANDDGNFIDPIVMAVTSNWNNSANAPFHTQSPRVRQFSGGSTGGMDDRFDLMLMSNGIMNSGGMYYIPGSFVAYGNDGNHYNDSINAPPNTAVSMDIANAIHYGSDHLPVYAKFTFPASVTTPAAQPTNLQFSSIGTTSMTGTFTAASPAPAGYLVLRKATSAPTGVPVNGSSYTSGGTLGDATVAYAGPATTFSNTGLTSGVTYYYKIFSFNGSGGSTTYLVSNPLSGSQATSSANPSVSVSTAGLTYANTEVNTISAVQSFTVSGANLTGSIILTPPVDFQISTSSNTGFISSPSTLSLSPSSGTVATTTVYARLAPLNASGSRNDSITITSTGTANSRVTLSGIALAAQPSVQSSVSFGVVTAGVLPVNFSGGNGARRILVGRQALAASFIPVDANTIGGVNSNFINASDQGDGNKVLYDGTGNTVAITGLSGSTQYYFAVFEYNTGTNNSQNYLTTSPGTGNYTTASSTFYTWNGGNGSFTTAANWTPARNNVSNADILQFDSGDSIRVTNVGTQTIGQLILTNNTRLTFAAAAICTLTVQGGAGTDLTVSYGSGLHLRGTSPIVVALPSGSSGSISGNVSLDSAAHRLLCSDTSGIIFNSGANFTTGNPNASSTYSGSPFGNTVANLVVFASGASFVYCSGTNPFALPAPASVVVFQLGSWFRIGRVNASPSYSGRIYANIELNLAGNNNSATGNALTFDTLRVLNGTINLNLTGGVNVKNAIIVQGSGAVVVNPAAAATVQFNGTGQQSISGSGTFTLGTLAKLKLNNASGLILKKDITLTDTLTLSNGILDLGENKLILGSNAGITGNFSATNMITATDTGEIRRLITGNSSFVFPVGGNGVYAPVTVSLTENGGLSSAYFGVRPVSSKHTANYAGTNYLNRNWVITGGGITSPVYSAVFTYGSADVRGTETNLTAGFWDGSKWTLGNAVDAGLHQFGFTNLNSFGSFSAASSDFVGGAALMKLTAALQGYFYTNISTMTRSDTLRAYLTNTVLPYTIVDSSVSVLDSASFEVLFKFRNINSGSYHTFFRHKNSLDTWLSNARSFVKGAYTAIDIMNDSSGVAGNNLKKYGRNWYIYSGDVNKDGAINFADIIQIDNDAVNFTGGYPITDLNGDGIVDFSDLILCENNAYNSVHVIKP